MAKKETVTEDVKVEETKEEKSNYNYPDIIRVALLKTGREGMIDLLGFMQEIGFLKAPCSGGNHLCKDEGLAEHSVNVMWQAEKIGVALLGGARYNEIQSSVVIAALLHDLGKCGDYGKALYVENILKTTKKRSVPKPFKRNPNLSNVPHAIRSIKLATLFIDLTEDEEWAILAHDGLYDFMKYEIQGHETELSMIIHWADMWASKVIEKNEESEGEN
ncbi:MAG: HD domain-containing protein [Lachnotalea sp.]